MRLFRKIERWFNSLWIYIKRAPLRRKMRKAGYPYSLILDCPSFDESIIGMTKEGRVVYVYEEMAIEFAKQCYKDYDTVDDDKRCEYIEEAFEFIDYNTIRALPYYASYNCPIVVSWDVEREQLVNVSGSEYEDFYFNEDTCFIFREDCGQYYSKEPYGEKPSEEK